MNNSRVATILRCLLFWGIFILLLIIVSPLSAMFPGAWPRAINGVLGVFATGLLTWL